MDATITSTTATPPDPGPEVVPRSPPPVSAEVQAFRNRFDADYAAVRWSELLFGLGALLAWFALFSGGVLVGTTSYIEQVRTGVSLPAAAQLICLIFLFWTITNVGLLSCLAAVIGAMGRRTRFAGRDTHDASDATDGEIPNAVVVHYASAIIRGFGVYGLVLAGLLVLATDVLVKPDQGGYVRLAGMISVISFYAGYDPEMFAGFLERVKRFIESK